MIILPKKNKLSAAVGTCFGIKAFFRLILREADETVVQDTGWFPNLITNDGMLIIRDGGGTRFKCELGSSSTAPSVTDDGPIASLGAAQSSTDIDTGYVSGTPEYWWERITYRHDVGESTGDVRELAIGEATPYFNRSLVINGGGSPTTITKGADQILDVYWERRNYPPTGDSTGTVNVGGVGFNYTVRPYRVNDPFSWESIGNREQLSASDSEYKASASGLVARDAITLTAPKTVESSGFAVSIIGTGTYYNDVQLQVGIDDWVFGGDGIKTMKIQTGSCSWQIQYLNTSDGKGILKTNEDRLRMKYRLGWVAL